MSANLILQMHAAPFFKIKTTKYLYSLYHCRVLRDFRETSTLRFRFKGQKGTSLLVCISRSHQNSLDKIPAVNPTAVHSKDSAGPQQHGKQHLIFV